MPTYESSGFSPPAPVARVVLQHPTRGAEEADVPMLLDTGADVTLVPRAVVERLGLEPAGGAGYELAGFDGHTRVATAVEARMILCGRGFRGRFLVSEEGYGIVGRNILNALPLVFDGPRREWAELDASARTHS